MAVFDVTDVTVGRPKTQAVGFIPTEWYPTVVAATGKELLIASAKGKGSGPNPNVIGKLADGRPKYQYGPAMIHGSLARIPLADISANLPAYTKQVVETNALRGNGDSVSFTGGENKIKHVIYIIKENRTYDQVFGDIAGANGDPSLAIYGENITPISTNWRGNSGFWTISTTAGRYPGTGMCGRLRVRSPTISRKRGRSAIAAASQHTYEAEGTLLSGISREDEVPDAGEPTGGYLWKNFASHGISYRHYGEYIVSRWCNEKDNEELSATGPPKVLAKLQARGDQQRRAAGEQCRRAEGRTEPLSVGDSGAGGECGERRIARALRSAVCEFSRWPTRISCARMNF